MYYRHIYIYFFPIYKMKTERKRKMLVMHIIIFVVVIALVFFVIRCAVSHGFFGKFWWPQICANTQCFKLEIVDTPKTREIWLMNRTSLDKDRWMLFVFEQSGPYSFRMKNTLIPLDMLRLDDNYNIVYIQNMAQPCTTDPCPMYNPWTTANYVLELNWWVAGELGIKVGDSITFKK